MLASRNLNVPLIYTKQNEITNPVENSNVSDTSESNQHSHHQGVKPKIVLSNEENKSQLDDKINEDNEINQTNSRSIDCSLTCISKINRDLNNEKLICVSSGCNVLGNACFCKQCPPSKVHYANYDIVDTAINTSGELPGNDTSEVLCTLKGILAQLQLMNKSTSQISVISETMQKLLQDKKTIPGESCLIANSQIRQNCTTKADENSLNWTSEQNKWITPPNISIKEIREQNMQVKNPIHSTPMQIDKSRNDLHQIINDTTVTNSVIKPTDLSFSFDSTANVLSSNHVNYPLEPQVVVIPLTKTLEPEDTTMHPATSIENQEPEKITITPTIPKPETESTTITPVVDDSPSTGIMGHFLVKFLAAVIVSNVIRLQKVPK